MRIKQVYIGGWFQRTTLHLSEVYDFIRDGSSQLALDDAKLKALQQSLNVSSIELKITDFEYLLLTTHEGVTLKIFEDGLIVLHCQSDSAADLAHDIATLTSYYEQRLSPAFSYIFSLGAPVPKELANIKTVYPYFVVTEEASQNEVSGLLDSFGESKYFETKNPHFELFRGDKFYAINLKSASLGGAERFIEEQVFLREFKGQLHRYLNLHRIIWERIAEVKERGTMKGSEIGNFNDKIEGYAKTINLIEARINQMNAYLRTRERIAKDDKDLIPFLAVIEYRYETLADTLAYIQQVWSMTKNYVASAQELFSSIQAKATQNSVQSLTVVTSVGVGASLISLFTGSAPTFSLFGVYYFVALAIIGYAANKTIKWFYGRKSYGVSEVQIDKDIK